MNFVHIQQSAIALVAILVFQQLSSSAYAQTTAQTTVPTAEEYFDLGVEASRNEDYQQALQAFLAAADSGMDSAALHYNLGVVHYRLQTFEQASDAFRALLDYKGYGPLANYNLGLIQLKLDNENQAIHYFWKTYSTAEDENLQALSDKALRRLNVDVKTFQTKPSDWRGFASAALGYDDNVALVNEDIDVTKGVSDTYAEILATVNTLLLGYKENGLRFDANIDLLEYQTEKDYNYLQWHVGLSHEGKFREWQTRAGLRYDRTQFGGADFQQLLEGELRGKHNLSGRTRLDLRYRYTDISDISSGSQYTYLEGVRHTLRARLTDKRFKSQFKYSYTFQLNDRNDFSTEFTDPNTPTNGQTTTTRIFRSYSPLRHTFRIRSDVPIYKKLGAGVELQYRYSQYQDTDTRRVIVTDDNNNNAVLSDTTTSLKREDKRYIIGTELNYTINRAFDVYIDYAFTRNTSNREESEYDRSLINLGVNWYY